VTDHLAALDDLVCLGNALGRQASPDGVCKACLSQPLAEFGNGGSAGLAHVMDQKEPQHDRVLHHPERRQHQNLITGGAPGVADAIVISEIPLVAG
jgi:hypothetical protein